MAIPDYQLIISPLLKLIENGEEISLRDAVDKLAKYFKLQELFFLLLSNPHLPHKTRIGLSSVSLF